MMIKSKQKGHLLEFDSGSHRYFLTKKGEEKRRPLVSVTTIQKGFPVAEALIQWRIKNKVAEMISGKILDYAGALGTMAHDMFRKYERGEKVDVPDIDEIKNIWGLFIDWHEKKGSKDKILKQEVLMCSPSMMIGGTFDRLSERDGQIILSDYKTANSVYASAWFQLAGYDLLLKEWLDIKVDKWEILRFGKKDEKYEVVIKSDREEMIAYQEQFKRNWETYKFINSYGS